jgi:hypothetical protein
MARRSGRTGRAVMTALVFIGAAWVFDQAVWPLIRMVTAGDSAVRLAAVVLLHAAVIAVAYAVLRGRISAGLFTVMTALYAALATLAWIAFGLPGALRLTGVSLESWAGLIG